MPCSAQDLIQLLNEQKKMGRRIAGYGASAKGSTLFNYLRLPGGTIDLVVDRSKIKQERLSSGTLLPIYAAEKLLVLPDRNRVRSRRRARRALERPSLRH
jgi:hypothetical protein